ncbi:MAG: hypothetical protein ACSHYC_00115 [Alphaproteobacteria bacterium]
MNELKYGPRTTVYNRCVRWGERGVRQEIFEVLAQECEDALFFIDASIVKAHRAAAGSTKEELEEGIGRSRGLLSDASIAEKELVARAKSTQLWTR